MKPNAIVLDDRDILDLITTEMKRQGYKYRPRISLFAQEEDGELLELRYGSERHLTVIVTVNEDDLIEKQVENLFRDEEDDE